MKKFFSVLAAALTISTLSFGSLALAEDNASTTPPPAGEAMMHRDAATIDVACIQAAVDKRDNAMIAAIDAYHTSTVSALTTRRDAIKAAWAITDRAARRAALKDAWKTFRDSHRATNKTLRDARISAWSTFRTERKACNAKVSDDYTTSGVDATL